MTKFTFRAALLSVLALGSASTAAFAADTTAKMGGHYEWRQTRQFGPRAPLTAPQRVWVLNDAQMAHCDCDMMKMSAADCMMMQGKQKAPSAG